MTTVFDNVGDPDPHVFGHPGSGSIVRGMDPDPTPFSHKDVERTEIMLAGKVIRKTMKKGNFLHPLSH